LIEVWQCSSDGSFPAIFVKLHETGSNYLGIFIMKSEKKDTNVMKSERKDTKIMKSERKDSKIKPPKEQSKQEVNPHIVFLDLIPERIS
jgi:hypothetical protein